MKIKFRELKRLFLSGRGWTAKEMLNQGWITWEDYFKFTILEKQSAIETAIAKVGITKAELEMAKNSLKEFVRIRDLKC